jgi:hypothetical protein
MRPTIPQDANHKFSKPENWDDAKDGTCGDLLVRFQTYGERNVVEIVSAWVPDAAELVMLNNGGSIEIGLSTTTQPPMRAYAVPAAEVEVADRPAAITINEEAHGHG